MLGDVLWHDGPPYSRHRGRCSAHRSSARRPWGFRPMLGSELEFYLLRETYSQAWEQRYED